MASDQSRQYQAAPFYSMVRASGHGETWTHSNDAHKFNQYGWRCYTSENGYSTGTLIGNWIEERHDISQLAQDRPLPSDLNHNYTTTYNHAYGFEMYDVPETLKGLKNRLPRAHPSLQPELDTLDRKAEWSSFETEQRRAFVPPEVRKAPVGTRLDDPICQDGYRPLHQSE